MNLSDWLHVSFDDAQVHMKANPPEKPGWEQSFAWDDIIRICFENGD